jgi:PTS system N-acetylglucosamine-specific IIC component
VIGPIYAVVYYFVFRFMILKFDLKTPGREPDEELEALGDHGGQSAERAPAVADRVLDR